MEPRASGDPDGADAPSAFPRKVPRPCPTCGLAVPMGETRCPRCRTLLVSGCTGACTSCGARTCLRGDAADTDP
jgi:hypothetical protein